MYGYEFCKTLMRYMGQTALGLEVYLNIMFRNVQFILNCRWITAGIYDVWRNLALKRVVPSFIIIF